jgi:hypothetical protein
MTGRVARGHGLVVGALLILAAFARDLSAQRTISASGVGAAAHHRVNGARGIERSSGTMFGAEAGWRSGGWLEIDARMLTGSLAADSVNAEARDVTQAEIEVGVLPAPWVALQLGVETRSFATELLRQRWIAVRTGAEARMDFVGGSVQGIVRLALMPSVSVSGIKSPDIALAAGTGLEMDRGRFTAGVLYSFERFDFPPEGSSKRLEQFSILSARFGLRLGR